MKLKIQCALLFLAGLGCGAGVLCFYQDLLGLDGYIAYLRNHWVVFPPWFGALGIIMNVLSGVWWYFEIREYMMKERVKKGRWGGVPPDDTESFYKKG